ncbi:MAG: cytochrome c [Gammaproteobacteria bacterium]|nr:cytochrome c [Gammaproteobacteria bacterium]
MKKTSNRNSSAVRAGIAASRTKRSAARLCGALLPLLLPSFAAADGDAARGEATYRVLCTQCHGINGDGYGVNTRDMAVLPRDHTDSGEMSARTDADLFKAIQGGGPAVNKSVLMPAWGGNLDDQGIEDLVAYLRKLCCSDKQ